jgi:hypothetical protein
MDFDHRDPARKRGEISTMVKRLVPWATILAELAKCDLVCANCHRLRTYKGQNCYKTRQFEYHKHILDELKATTPCFDCGRTYDPCQMDFDHTGDEIKVHNISRLVGRSTEALTLELHKCQLVCANCHRIRSVTKVRPEGNGDALAQRFLKIQSELCAPQDRRLSPFPHPELLGEISDKELAAQTGISRQMVAWYRRKAGIMLKHQGRRAA